MESRQWPDGSITTRAEADALGWNWAAICLYTDPVDEEDDDD